MQQRANPNFLAHSLATSTVFEVCFKCYDPLTDNDQYALALALYLLRILAGLENRVSLPLPFSQNLSYKKITVDYGVKSTLTQCSFRI
jgi:hypothetical protein